MVIAGWREGNPDILYGKYCKEVGQICQVDQESFKSLLCFYFQKFWKWIGYPGGHSKRRLGDKYSTSRTDPAIYPSKCEEPADYQAK